MRKRLTNLEVRMANLLEAMRPVIERKSHQGAGPCVHDIRNADDFSLWLRMIDAILAEIPPEPEE